VTAFSSIKKRDEQYIMDRFVSDPLLDLLKSILLERQESWQTARPPNLDLTSADNDKIDKFFSFVLDEKRGPISLDQLWIEYEDLARRTRDAKSWEDIPGPLQEELENAGYEKDDLEGSGT
jgi:hypothetical protein